MSFKRRGVESIVLVSRHCRSFNSDAGNQNRVVLARPIWRQSLMAGNCILRPTHDRVVAAASTWNWNPPLTWLTSLKVRRQRSLGMQKV